MAGLYLLGLLACVFPMASFQTSHPLLVLTEACYYPLNMTYIENELLTLNITADILGKEETCENHQKLLHVLSTTSRLVVGSFHPEVCASVRHLSEYFNKTFHSWNCPSIFGDKDIFQQSPSLTEIAGGFARVVEDMKWKSVAVIATASGWWPLLSHSLELELRELDIIPKHSFLFEGNVSLRYIERKLRMLKKSPCRALVFCLPPDDIGIKILEAVRHLQLSLDNTLFIFLDVLSLPSWKSNFQKLKETIEHNKNKTNTNTQDIATMSQDFLLFVENDTLDSTFEDYLIKNIRENFEISFMRFHSRDSLYFVLVDLHSNASLRPLLKVLETNASVFEIETLPSNFDEWWVTHKQLDECDAFCKLTSDNLFSAWVYWIISCSVLFVFLILGVVAVVRYRLLKKRTSKAPYKVLLMASDFTFPQLADSRRFKCKRQNSVSGAGKNICQFYEELDLLYGGRPNILAIDNDGIDTALFNEDTATEEEINAQEVETTSDEHNLLQELREEQYELTDTDDTDGIRTPKRKQDKSGESSKKKYQKFEYSGRKSYEAALNSFSEKMLKGQRNILESILQKQTTSCADIFQREMEAQRKWEEMMEKEREFQKEQTSVIMQNFQQSLQTLRPTTQMLNPYTPLKLIPVDEGIEAMLCCWLQQLQEFGGPEVDKPDLLQNSGGASARTPLRTSSSPNLAKQIIVDPRVRYNGDLVQMKPVPSSGSCELRAKAIELLVLLHGLRHENLNPLIGVLAEPPRAALVSEYCARGSLQDVLQQDDIKLDWSFRLSLLTDLVRGMKYLHSTQIKVHGYLTSKNCVIDSRWVLKVTDYGLSAFYEAQGIQAATKTARELLWTAPELLRHNNLRKKGTQPGDVYSFGIILQEVVVRGEPFCMLALTPEEIIEKVIHPPPLIRPSVSKGAAPPEAINIMRQCWAEQAEMRPDFNTVHDQFKKLNHGRKVNIVDTMFQMLEKYSNNLEELIRERTEQLDIEKKKTEQLLNRMLPSYVADKLKLGMPVDPEEYEEVTIYFSDIVGFTTISVHSTPFQVVDLLNDLYTCFDATINAYNVYKVETIGDAYMVVGGLPVRIPDHAEQIATMALDLLHESGKFCIRHLPGTPLRLRIGLHTGPCCAGVVGLTMPRYCLFGDTVNTASRMESTGAAWRIHMSEATKTHLEKAGGYHIEYRGPTEIKGKGTMDTYWLLGREGFNKELPNPPSIELDESLIISTLVNIPTLKEDSVGDSVSLESSRHMSVSDGTTKTPSPNPTFMKSMEYSKFSTLTRTHDDKSSDRIVKSTSSDTPLILGTPVSASEVAAALLGASTSSLCPYRRGHRAPSKIQEEQEDISTPYNHYKCLSPKLRTGKLLRRQFSLDRTEEINKRDEELASPRLCKQNSAGAADLEKIEEVPLRIPSTTLSTSSQIQCTLSVSVDSLIR